MPKPKKQPPASFTSMQIISAKAQSLWAKARSKMAQERGVSPAASKQSESVSLPVEAPRQAMHVEISMSTVAMATITVIGVILAATALYILRDKFLLLMLAFFLSVVIDSSVRFLESHRVPRSLAVLLMYFVFLGLAIFLVASLIPIVANELQNFAGYLNAQADAFINNPHFSLPFLSASLNAKLTIIAQNVVENLNLKDRASTLVRFSQNLSAAATTSLALAVSLAGSVFNLVASFILILFLTFFIQMEREKIKQFFRILLPLKYRGYYDEKAEAIYIKMSQWFQGQMILCLCIGILVFIALTILRVPYALTLALLAGFTEFIPVAGPLLAAMPAVFIVLSKFGFVWALVIAGVYYVIQACENNLLVPLVMKHAVGLSPIVIMFGMLVGISFPDTVHPILGIILSVPTTTIIAIFLKDLIEARKRKA